MNKNEKNVRGALAAAALLGIGMAGSPARAQFGGENLPDLSGVAGEIGKAASDAPPAPKAGEVFRSGLTVPSVQPGATARDIGRQLRTKVEAQAGPQPGLAKLEEGMPKALSALEGQLEGIGFAKRDMGVAVGYFFIYNYETATGKTVPEGPSKIAARTVATAVAKRWGPQFNALAPAAKEKTYESLLISTTLLSALAQQFDKAGKAQEAAGMRQAAGALFQKLIGVPPSQVKIDDAGRITGLASGSPAGAAKAEATGAARSDSTPPPAPVAASGPLPAASLGGAQVFVKYRMSYYPAMTTNFDHLILFPDGTAFDDIPSKDMPRFDAANLRSMLRPREVGTWKKSGNTIVLNFPSGGDSRTLRKHPKGWYDGKGTPKPDNAYDVYYPVIVPTKQALLGPWKSQSLTTSGMVGGGAPMVAAGSNSNRVFRPDGTYTYDRKGFASATTANMGDAFKSGGDVGVYSKNKNAAAGRWRLDGPLLTMEKDGKSTVHVAFILPNWSKDASKKDMMIDGDWWRRPGKD